MPLLLFDFEPDIYRDPLSNKFAFIYRPYLFVRLANKTKRSPNLIRALVDSGADNNVFPAAFAEEIGLSFKNGKVHKIYGVGEYEITTFVHSVKLIVGKREIDTAVQFSELITTPLLGRLGFFAYYKRISFDLKQKKLELKY